MTSLCLVQERFLTFPRCLGPLVQVGFVVLDYLSMVINSRCVEASRYRFGKN